MNRRTLKRTAIAVAILAAFAVAWAIYQEWQRQRLIDDVGDMADLLEPLPEDENAAPLYRKAHEEFEMARHVFANLTEDPMVALGDTKGCPCKADPDADYQPTPFDDEMRAAAARYIAAAAPAYDLLIEIDNYERARFGDYSNPADYALGGLPLDDLSRTREIARQIMYRAKWELRNGRPEAALVWVERGLRLANHLADDGTIIFFLVRKAVAAIAIGALNDVLCATEPAVEIPFGILHELRRTQERSQYGQVFASERIVERAMWEYTRAALNPFQKIELAAEQRAADETLLAAMRAATEPDAQTRRRLLSEIDPPPGLRERLYELVDVVYSPMWAQLIGGKRTTTQMAAEFVDTFIAEAAMAEIAVYLFQYRTEHGDYPDALRELVPEFAVTLLTDPFSGHRFFYKPSESGYLLYSVGRDGDDDGGWVDWWEGDVVWCVGQ